MRIQGIASFYDASSRINGIDRVSRVNKVEEANSVVSKPSESKINVTSDNYNGIQQTLVSPENAYQKQMLNDREFAMMRMAGKLMDKLPQIAEDMKNLPDTIITEPAEVVASEPKKIVIGENSNADYSGNAAAPLQDISL